MNALLARLYVHNVHVWCPWRTQEGIRLPETGVVDGCELPCGYWAPNLHFLQEWPVLVTADPSSQPTHAFFLLICLFGLVWFIEIGS